MLLKVLQVPIMLNFSELQITATESDFKSKLTDLLSELGWFKFMTSLVLILKKMEIKDKTNYDHFYSSSKAGIIINESDIDDVFKSICSTIIYQTYKNL